mmetsp:Transcript_35028/g.103743  ORF Transcript_35028/g.103743 Transcript_35028/m.103743 type:complete len:155 (-) Transcript_35028:197-661(-)
MRSQPLMDPAAAASSRHKKQSIWTKRGPMGANIWDFFKLCIIMSVFFSVCFGGAYLVAWYHGELNPSAATAGKWTHVGGVGIRDPRVAAAVRANNHRLAQERKAAAQAGVEEDLKEAIKAELRAEMEAERGRAASAGHAAGGGGAGHAHGRDVA